jgi:hypothetical protein
VSHLAERLVRSFADALEQPTERYGPKLVDGDRPVSKDRDMPRPWRLRYLVEHRCNDRTFGEPLKPVIGYDENESSPLVSTIGEPNLASRRGQRKSSIQLSISASTR